MEPDHANHPFCPNQRNCGRKSEVERATRNMNSYYIVDYIHLFIWHLSGTTSLYGQYVNTVELFISHIILRSKNLDECVSTVNSVRACVCAYVFVCELY